MLARSFDVAGVHHYWCWCASSPTPVLQAGLVRRRWRLVRHCGGAAAQRALKRALYRPMGLPSDMLAAARELLPKLVEVERQLLQRERETNRESAAQMATAAAKAAMEPS